MNRLIYKHNYRVQECLIDSDKVVFVFTGMLTKIWQYRFFIKRLNKAGYSVVIYDYPSRLVHDAKFEEWLEFFDVLVDDAQKRINEFRQDGVRAFYAYGYSMGTLVAHKLARETPDIHHVILNLTYGDVAANVWISPRTRKAKKNLLKRGVSIEELRQNVASFDPIVNVKGLKGKKVLLHLAKRDRILHYPITKETKAAFEQAGLNMQYFENRYLGHIAGGIKNMLSIKKIKAFYDS